MGESIAPFSFVLESRTSVPFPILDVLLTSFDCHVICIYDFSGWPNVMERPPYKDSL